MIDTDPIGWFITLSIIIGTLAIVFIIAEVLWFFDRSMFNRKTKTEYDSWKKMAREIERKTYNG